MLQGIALAAALFVMLVGVAQLLLKRYLVRKRQYYSQPFDRRPIALDEIGGVALSPHGEYVAALRAQGFSHLTDLTDGNELHARRFHCESTFVSDDGAVLAFVTYQMPTGRRTSIWQLLRHGTRHHSQVFFRSAFGDYDDLWTHPGPVGLERPYSHDDPSRVRNLVVWYPPDHGPQVALAVHREWMESLMEERGASPTLFRDGDDVLAYLASVDGREKRAMRLDIEGFADDLLINSDLDDA